MIQTHRLMRELVGGTNPPTKLRFVPTVTTLKFCLRDMLMKSSDASRDISVFLQNAKPASKNAIAEFVESINAKDSVDELTALANLSRNVLRWLQEIEESLRAEDRINMIFKAISPMAWLEALIKTVEFKLMVTPRN